MSNVNTNTGPDEQPDIAVLGHDAKDYKDRRLALDALLTGDWIGSDIGRLERVDTVKFHGWRMWEWQKDDGKS